MARPSDNPFVNFPADYTEGVMLTMFQSVALPILLWFFDTNVGRGTGRSYLAAVLVIELAKRNGRVQLDGDPSLLLSKRLATHCDKKDFFMLVLQIASKYYPRDKFSWGNDDYTVRYNGKSPR